MHSRGRSSEQIRHMEERLMYRELVHFQIFAHGTQEAPIGQQPVCPLARCAPQQTPGEVWEKARLQSFLKQQLSQPTLARERRFSATGATCFSGAAPAATAATARARATGRSIMVSWLGWFSTSALPPRACFGGPRKTSKFCSA